MVNEAHGLNPVEEPPDSHDPVGFNQYKEAILNPIYPLDKVPLMRIPDYREIVEVGYGEATLRDLNSGGCRRYLETKMATPMTLLALGQSQLT